MPVTDMGSPLKGSSFKEQYLQQLKENGESLEPLKPRSSSRINSENNSQKINKVKSKFLENNTTPKINKIKSSFLDENESENNSKSNSENSKLVNSPLKDNIFLQNDKGKSPDRFVSPKAKPLKEFRNPEKSSYLKFTGGVSDNKSSETVNNASKNLTKSPKTLTQSKFSYQKLNGNISKETKLVNDKIAKMESPFKNNNSSAKETSANTSILAKKEALFKKDTLTEKEGLLKKDTIANKEIPLKKNTITNKKNTFNNSTGIKENQTTNRDAIATDESLINKATNSATTSSHTESKTFDASKLSKLELKYYEFLCRVSEAKTWIEEITGDTLPAVIDILSKNSLRDGVALAKLAQKINPQLVHTVHPATIKFKFKLMENIQNFLLLVDVARVPDVLRFETTDLYDGKNIPKVFETLHALAYVLHKKWPNKVPAMKNVSGIESFSSDEIRRCKINFPNIRSFDFFANDVNTTIPNSGTLNTPEGLINDFDKPESVATNRDNLSSNRFSGNILEDGEKQFLNHDEEAESSDENYSRIPRNNKKSTKKSAGFSKNKYKTNNDDIANEEEESEEEKEEEVVIVEEEGMKKKRDESEEEEEEEEEIITKIIRKKVKKEPKIIKKKTIIKKIIKEEESDEEEESGEENEEPVNMIEVGTDPAQNIEYNEEDDSIANDGLSSVKHTSPKYAENTTSTKNPFISPHRRNYDYYDIPISPSKHSPYKPRKRFERAPIKDISTIPSLQYYTPRKDISYYSPTLNRRLSTRRRIREVEVPSFTTTSSYEYPERDFFLERPHTYLQSRISPNKAKRMTELEFLDTLCEIQALCRGSNLRYIIYDIDSKMELCIPQILNTQSRIRGFITRKKMGLKDRAIKFEEFGPLVDLQAKIRAYRIRDDMDKLLFRVMKHQLTVESIQSYIRASKLRRGVKTQANNIDRNLPAINLLQSIYRGVKVRDKVIEDVTNIRVYEDSIARLQSIVRGTLYRRTSNVQKYFTDNNTSNMEIVLRVQSYIRAAKKRDDIYALNDALINFDSKLDWFAAYIQGGFARRKVFKVVRKSHSTMESIQLLQANVRGVLTRYTLDVLNEILHNEPLDLLKAICRGSLVRQALRDMDAYYRKHKREIIKIQSKFRAYTMKMAYHEIMSFANPSLWAVRKFAFLLNGVQPTFETQDALEHSKELIDKENVDISKLEHKLRKLVQKMNLLNDNNLKVSDTPYIDIQKILNSSGNSVSDESGIEIDLFEKIFYLLQVDPFYFRLLFTTNKNKILKYLSLIYFKRDGSMGHRENTLYVKLVSEMLMVDIDSRAEIEDFLCDERNTDSWKLLLHVYLVSQKKTIMKQLFADVVSSIDSVNVDFESDPSIIYCKLHPTSSRLPAETAVEDDATKARYVANMGTLWSFIDRIHRILSMHIAELPIEVLYLCTKAYVTVAGKSSDELDALEAISKIIIGSFVNDFLVNCSDYGVEISHGQETMGKLKILCESLNVVFSLRKFKHFYSPLNQYVAEVNKDIAETLQSLQIPPKYEEYMESLVYRDMNNGNRPVLVINAKYLDEIYHFLSENIEIFPQDDPMVRLVDDLAEKETVRNKFGKGQVVTLELNPSAYKLSDVDDRGKAMYNDVMWGLIYMLQVFTSKATNVLEVLTLPGNDTQEELKFKKLLQQYPSIRENSVFKDLPSNSYFDLKMYISEKTLELDTMGFIDRAGNFQCLLNDIANTIKCHVYVKTRNLKEIDVANTTIKELKQKRTTLEKNYKSLNEVIHQSLDCIQSSNDYSPKKKKAHGLGGKLKKMYSKVNHKQVSEADCAHYKFSTRQLFEKGVLIDIIGEKLGSLPMNYFGNSGPKFPDVDFIISTANGKQFIIEMVDSRKGVNRTGHTSDKFNFNTLLDSQLEEGNKKLKLIGGKVIFNSKNLFNLVIQYFYTIDNTF
ncbi:Iqg1p SCDLUD_001158 [Saccharomycodes ludwigii]|uniref:Iqg1p n=1 Tax=Saccharomycodes ludwigii TaxID=36035 RepID=UPI001E8C4BF9|nr:hypothetical protein SCDLUD_001158 [Saccharomycodes ludwigii]KAH3903517.1 hypothetical protein SCDLUD_001158 [Saccharomycodes ludwigii]